MGRLGGGGGDAGGGKRSSNVVFERVVPKFLKGLVSEDAPPASKEATRSASKTNTEERMATAAVSARPAEDGGDSGPGGSRVLDELAALRAEGFAVDATDAAGDGADGPAAEGVAEANAGEEAALAGRTPKRKHATVGGRVEKKRKGGSLVKASAGSKGFGSGDRGVLSFGGGSSGSDSDESGGSGA